MEEKKKKKKIGQKKASIRSRKEGKE